GIRPEKGRNWLLIFIFAFKGWGFSPAFFLPRFFAYGTGTTIQLLALRLDSYRIISIRTSCKRNSPPADRKKEFNGLGSQERANGKFASNVGGNRSHRAGVLGIGRSQSHGAARLRRTGKNSGDGAPGCPAAYKNQGLQSDHGESREVRQTDERRNRHRSGGRGIRRRGSAGQRYRERRDEYRRSRRAR